MIETRFKDTEVGRIPEDWDIKQLGKNILYLRTGLNPRVHFRLNTPDADGFYITVRELHGFDIVVDEQTDRINHQAAERINNRAKLKVGDVLFSGTGTIGQTALVKEEPINWGIKEGIYAITPDSHKLDSVFLIYYLHTTKAIALYSSMSSGSTISSVPMTKFINLPISLPSLSEQKRIALALSNIDALISELGKLIEKKRAIKQGAMQQLFTGKQRLRGFSEPWVEKKLGEICEFQNGYTPSKAVNSFWENGTIPWFRMEDIRTNGRILSDAIQHITEEAVKGSLFPANSIIMSTTATIGEHALLIVDSLANQRFTNLTFRKSLTQAVDVMWFYHYCFILGEWCKMNINEGGLASVNMIDFSNVMIPLPSVKEQSAIASVLTSMDNEISALEAKREKYSSIKQGMMQQLLTGKIRLVETAVKTNATFANVHFRRSVLAAEIADRLCEEPTFGHVKMEKMLFLTERLCRIDIGSHYHRDAAGPYDNRALRSIDSQLKKQKWFEVRRTEKGNRYVPMQNRGKHKTYFDKYFSAVLPTFEKIIDTFKTQNTERCEIVSTLYSAWEDFLNSNKTFTDADIVNEVLNNWHESKKRISRERWLNAIQWMRENGFVPNDRNG
ncbi:restriction endonuclease subunit S [Prevotella intermedia]|uniref:Restriction endonuclease subunit S n=1 Tax=Prevotella intermedia TaxID=28131 RepID=A0A2D3NCY9_PREIN|nr:restriction endonuclease subunit S [Prevotella intermedia]ATV53288.1 restriction endonuclease subunit S [Prevotella intermedia]